MNDAPHYTIEIKWSDEDSRYVVILPEWADRYAMPVADGATYEEAVARARNALENYIDLPGRTGYPCQSQPPTPVRPDHEDWWSMLCQPAKAGFAAERP